ncbi:hypothetical protein BGW42_004386 [Actinomortierella wolfii]|nr:hypothetical protein BGW42_004386 [Actinomortierella wolfii]
MSHIPNDKDVPPPDFIPLEADTDSSEEDDNDIEITMSGDSTVGGRRGKGGREKPKIPKHMRKSKPQIYDNISVYAPPDSALIFKCSKKKADWYLSRSLARQLSPTSIYLTFVPAGPGRAGDAYYLEERENKCVICGVTTADAGATMLHVVPEQYRKWLPVRLKSHSSHDILVACPECNADWDRGATVLRKRIVQLYQVPLEGIGWIRDSEASVAKRAAGAVVSEWRRQWETQRSTTLSILDDLIHQTSSSKVDVQQHSRGDDEEKDGQEEKPKKKNKTKKPNILPPERLKFLEGQVLQWWTATQKMQTSTTEEVDMETLSKKRDIASTESDDNSGAESSRKRFKESTVPSTGENKTSSDVSRAESDGHGHSSIDGVPPPPPGHSTELTSQILWHAMNVQFQYKSPDYKEHGQLVMARVMASSPEYHGDKGETPETLEMWAKATPIAPKEGWRNVAEFIRTWRKHFLDVTKPRHLSAEWKVDDPI